MEQPSEIPYIPVLPYDNKLPSISIDIRDHALIDVNITTNKDGREEWRCDKQSVPEGISLFISTSCDIGEVCKGPQDIKRIINQVSLGNRTPLEIFTGQSKLDFDTHLKHTFTSLALSHDPSNTTSLSPLTKVNRYYNKKYSSAKGDSQVEFNGKKRNSSGLTIIETGNISDKTYSDTIKLFQGINQAREYTRQQIIDSLAQLGFQNIFIFDLTCNQYQFNRPVDFYDLFDDASPKTIKRENKKRKKQQDEFKEFETEKNKEYEISNYKLIAKGGKLKNKKTKINKKNKKHKKTKINKKNKKTKKNY
jgi:hypothetical protein